MKERSKPGEIMKSCEVCGRDLTLQEMKKGKNCYYCQKKAIMELNKFADNKYKLPDPEEYGRKGEMAPESDIDIDTETTPIINEALQHAAAGFGEKRYTKIIIHGSSDDAFLKLQLPYEINDEYKEEIRKYCQLIFDFVHRLTVLGPVNPKFIDFLRAMFRDKAASGTNPWDSSSV